MAKKVSRFQRPLFDDVLEDPPVEAEVEPADPPLLVVRNASQLVCVSQQGEQVKRGSAMRNVAVIENGTVLIRQGRIEWVGPTAKLPRLSADAKILDASHKTVMPGLIDSHTHLIFAGSREEEFEERLQGASYQEISARGGGINATVRRVREAAADQLKELARARLQRLLRFGVTTVEVKRATD
jgi:imidazolonepropionase